MSTAAARRSSPRGVRVEDRPSPSSSPRARTNKLPREAAVLIVLTDKELLSLGELQKFYDTEWSELVRTLINDRQAVLAAVLADTTRRPYDFLSFAEAERQHLVRVLERCDFNLGETAHTLDIPLSSLKARMAKHAIKKPAVPEVT